MATRVTIGDIARQLKLSTATVSYALNGQPGVSESTRQRVQALADELGWYPSASARALSKARSEAIGVVLNRAPELIGTEPYYMQVIAGMESVLAEADMALLLRIVGAEPGRDLDTYRRWAGQRRVDGVVLFDEREDDPRVALLEELRLPAVLQGGPLQHSSIRYVAPDDPTSSRLIVGHLAQLGHREVAHVTGPVTLMHEQRRWEHIRHEAAAHGVAARKVVGNYSIDGGRDATAALLAAGEPPGAIIYSNDLMALGGLRATRDLGVSVPGDLALVSWDDSMLCAVSTPAITAVDRQPVEYGRRTARALLEVIDGRPPSHEPAPASTLQVRATTVAG